VTPPEAHRYELALAMQRQPDDTTCGPTCLHAVYQYYGEDLGLSEVIASTRTLQDGQAGRGTLAVMLGTHALERGYAATLYTYNLHMFDPTWFGDKSHSASAAFLAEKLAAQAAAKCDAAPKDQVATEAYQEFLRLGGRIEFRDLTARLLGGLIRGGRPVLTGLSATYLYHCAREFGPEDDYDDVRGVAAGHFVVLHGYDPARRLVTVADPLEPNPAYDSGSYTVAMSRLVPAIMLGVLTHDANLLVIEPRQEQEPASEG
jgi:hypothetical protein